MVGVVPPSRARRGRADRGHGHDRRARPVGEPVEDGKSLVYTFTFPAQEHKIRESGVDPATEKTYDVHVDDEHGIITMRRSAQRADEPLPARSFPGSRSTTRSTGTRSSGSPRRISTASGAASSPRSSSGGRRRRGSTSPVPEAALSLDGSYLFVQGPPGSGKTWQGAKMAVALMRAGQRVGVTSLEPQGDLEAPRGDRARGTRAGLRVPRPQEVDSRQRGHALRGAVHRLRRRLARPSRRGAPARRGHVVALRARGLRGLPRHAVRRRGGPGLARRRGRGRAHGAEPRLARRPEPAAAGLAGRDAGRGEGVRPPAPARRGDDRAAGPRDLPRAHVAPAARADRVHVRGVLRRPARVRGAVRTAERRGRERARLPAGRARGERAALAGGGGRGRGARSASCSAPSTRTRTARPVRSGSTTSSS